MTAAAKGYHGNATNTSNRAGAGDIGVDVSYNNIYYMGMVNGILLGTSGAPRGPSTGGSQIKKIY